MFTWMYWTPEVAIFFACVVVMLAGMTVWELRSPTIERKGFLPITTTRGDRLFIGLLAAAYVNLGWVAMTAPRVPVRGRVSRPRCWCCSRHVEGLKRDARN